jgi:branched-chain amino acid transport system permease protein
MLEKTLQILIFGIALGSIYALVALGFNLIYKASKVTNFAHGEFLMLGAYAAYTSVVMLGLPLPLALIVTLAMAAVLGLAVERLMIQNLIGQPVLSIVVATLGAGLVLRGVAAMVWGVADRPFPTMFPSVPFKIGRLVIPSVYFTSFLISVVLLLAFFAFFHRTRLGTAMRAVAEDQQAALSVGLSVRKVFMLIWMLGTAVAFIGGILLGNIFSIAGQDLVLTLLVVFPAAIVGGLDSVGGAVVGGLLIGLVEVLGGVLQPYVGPGFRQVLPMIAAVIFLLFRPYGFFGTRTIERV